ncbi:uncharacterized protein LOC105398756 isoform X2 [Plutella xylostella]|uniref:uncharacterized protein LOC105398756 isoform X1 n=1 Tax=Plutella xylostella TaxID=51655 RepID=UPI00203276CF|nr:uncharacterized protein LOC105398756 isoform X1 [Plutella xylostella]XP_048487273.1 uncharacterized protein LOC105398756 isoform X2 [Plutella xylostella]
MFLQVLSLCLLLSPALAGYFHRHPDHYHHSGHYHSGEDSGSSSDEGGYSSSSDEDKGGPDKYHHHSWHHHGPPPYGSWHDHQPPKGGWHDHQPPKGSWHDFEPPKDGWHHFHMPGFVHKHPDHHKEVIKGDGGNKGHENATVVEHKEEHNETKVEEPVVENNGTVVEQSGQGFIVSQAGGQGETMQGGEQVVETEASIANVTSTEAYKEFTNAVTEKVHVEEKKHDEEGHKHTGVYSGGGHSEGGHSEGGYEEKIEVLVPQTEKDVVTTEAVTEAQTVIVQGNGQGAIVEQGNQGANGEQGQAEVSSAPGSTESSTFFTNPPEDMHSTVLLSVHHDQPDVSDRDSTIDSGFVRIKPEVLDNRPTASAQTTPEVFSAPQDSNSNPTVSTEQNTFASSPSQDSIQWQDVEMPQANIQDVFGTPVTSQPTGAPSTLPDALISAVFPTPEAISRLPRRAAPAGTFLGSWMTSRKGRRFEAYRGIRYAEPPVGELRFELARPILSHPLPVDASAEGPACPTRAPEEYYVNFSEDCLRVNVYTPGNSSRPLPVIVFIHAGGFYSMSGRSDLAGPHYLLDRDVVLVTINYRLGSLGFLSTDDELAPGNNGLKDQVVALQWVQRNIAAFGGDPNLVTIAGCSAGSYSVLLHMISPMSKGLFHRAISLSGSPIRKVPTPRHLRPLAVRQAELLNCPTDSSRAIVDCLRTKTWREIGDSLSGFFEFDYDPVGLWMPIIERPLGQERFLTEDPADAVKSGRMYAVPYIVSQTQAEFYWKAFRVLKNATLLAQMNSNWTAIAPISFILDRSGPSLAVSSALRKAYLNDRPLADDEQSARGLGTLYGDAVIGFEVHRLANLMSKYSPHKVFYSEFAYVGDSSHYVDPQTNRPIGAMHHDDLIYLFSLSYAFPFISAESKHGPFVDIMTGLWSTFARYGDPNPRGDIPEIANISWPAMTPAGRKYLRLGNQITVRERLFEERFRLWESLFPFQY